MCGITGFQGSFDPQLLAEMTALIAHRGPDDEGTWIDAQAGVGLGQRRLSIIDLSPLGHQPMWDVNRLAVIVFNGEIYNFQELRQELETEGVQFRSRTDTEVLLNLYLRDGERMLSRLNGIFAFAIWDTRRQSLFLARDGVGVKPLYFAETPAGFLFSSEMKSLLAYRALDRSINLRAVHHYLTYLWCPPPDTMLNAVRKLPPGCAMFVQHGRIQRTWPYYDLPYRQPIADVSEEAAAEEIRSAIARAVQRQMVADVPVGAFLSGGLDSSAVVAMAREHCQGRRLQCFTIGFAGDDSNSREGFADDLPYARRAAQALDVDLHTIFVGPEMAQQLEKMIYHLDEPQGDPAPINVLFISELARQHGVKVLLSGAGGDDIFGGYRRHYALTQERFWAWLPRPLRAGLKHAASRLPADVNWGRRLSKAFRYADRESAERIATYFHWLDEEVAAGLFARDVRNQISGPEPLMASLSSLPPHVEPLNQMLYLEGKHFLPDHNLSYTDKMSMAVGVEVRVPLLDLDLIDLAARLPIRFKQRGRVGKYIFKKAMEPLLPAEIIYRPKTGFGAPIRRWLRQDLKPLVDDVLSTESLRRRGLFDPDGVHSLMDMDRRGAIDGSYPIFTLVCLELWCRIFLDRPISPIA